MKKSVLAAVSATALLALSACAVEEADDTTLVTTDAEEPVPVDVPTTPVETATTGTGVGAEGAADDSVSVSEDGVRANINDGNTSVNADIDENPSLSVED